MVDSADIPLSLGCGRLLALHPRFAQSRLRAGRVSHIDIGGFDLSEVGPESFAKLWLSGGLPRSYLARSNATSLA